MCDPNTSYYIAQYVSGNSDLPRILACRETRPFHLGSKSPVVGLFKSDAIEIFRNIDRGTYRVDTQVYNQKLGQFECKSLPISCDLCSSVFRKCKGFSSFSSAKKFRVYSFFGKKIDEWRDELNCAVIEYNSLKGDVMSIADYLQSNRQWNYRKWLERNYPYDYYTYEYDVDQTYYAVRNAYKVSTSFDFNSISPYLDPLVTYLRLFERYETLRKSDQMVNFYELFNYIVDKTDYQTAMLAAYPLIYDNIPLVLPLYSPAFDNYTLDGVVCNAYSDAFVRSVAPMCNFYSDGIFQSKKLHRYSLFTSDYYKTYVNQQTKRFNDKNKSKKRNNTFVYGSRLID